MKRLLGWLAALALLMGMVQGAAAAEGMSPDIARILARGKLIVATTLIDSPPMYQISEDGTGVGIECDLAKEIADSLGVELEYLRYSDDYSRLQNAVMDGSADIIMCCYSNTLARARYLRFSDVYLSINYGMMANRSQLVQYGAEEDPAGFLLKTPMKLGVLGGSSHAAAVRTLFPACEIVEVFLEEGDPYQDAYDKAAYMVARGELFGYFCVEAEFVMQYLRHPDLSIYTKSYSFTDVSDAYAIGMNMQDAGLQQYVNLFLSQREPLSMNDLIAHYRNELEEGAAE